MAAVARSHGELGFSFEGVDVGSGSEATIVMVLDSVNFTVHEQGQNIVFGAHTDVSGCEPKQRSVES